MPAPEQFKIWFDRFCWFARITNPATKLPPVGLSALGCLLTLAFAVEVAIPLVSLLKLGWAEPLVLLLLPVTVTFILLYSSGWRREMPRTARGLRAALCACAIFGTVLFSSGVILVLGTILYMTLFVGFTAIHY